MCDGGTPRLRPWAFVCLFVLSSLLFGLQALAQQPRHFPSGAPLPNKPALGTIGERLNSNTIAIVSGNLNATYVTIAYDLSAVLDDGDEFRVLPVIGKGGGQNIKDVRFLKGVDLGITQANLLSYFKRTNEIGPIDDKIVYIAKLFNEEMHLIVRADSGITSLHDLAGKKVNFSDIGSGTQLSTRDVLEKLGIKAEEVNMGQGDAMEALKRGEIAATILVAGKPTGSTVKLKAADGFKILPVAFEKPLQTDYLPTTFTNEDYPGLIGPGEKVDTIAVGAALIAFNWPKGTDRYRRIQNFVDHFFPKLAEFQKAPRHPKWREANLAAVIPGWKRFEGAEEWLRNRDKLANADREQFGAFLAQRVSKNVALSSEERDRLFQEFLAWSKAREHR
ncbi:MAG TPA: TAXI family TRAP transporter solute-binding subunit [Xanthobacteraceae bacterium]|nr:TAXI family TRAP transporter solute-binding subunit [Xanthobacteraceae bacterium]